MRNATTGGLPYNDLAGVMEATANGWITSNGWYNLITYKTTTSPRLSDVTLGGYSLTVLCLHGATSAHNSLYA